MSDDRFAVLGGTSNDIVSSCEALGGIDVVDEHWGALPPMHDSRNSFACAAELDALSLPGDVRNLIGGYQRLPRDLPHQGELVWMGSALLWAARERMRLHPYNGTDVLLP